MTQSSEYNLRSFKEQFKKSGVYYTPPALAEWLKSLVPNNPKRVYDPTCGRGSLLSVFDDKVEKFGQDIDARAIADAEKYLSNFKGASGDVLNHPAFIDERFDVIVANPPFSIEWEPKTDGYFASAPTVPTRGKADFAFLIHILHVLADDGTAAVINFPGIAYRGGREQILRKWMVEMNVVDKVIAIPGKTFTDTTIPTLCIVFKKGRTSDTILFIDREHDLEREVPLSEVAANDFNLSVSSYVKREIEREQYDPIELERLARKGAIKRLQNELRFSRMVASLEGWDMSEFLIDIKKAIDDFEKENDANL